MTVTPHNQTPTIETRRLLLRPLELADGEQVQPLFGQWEIVRYLTNVVPWPYPPDASYFFTAMSLCRRLRAARSGTGRCG